MNFLISFLQLCFFFPFQEAVHLWVLRFCLYIEEGTTLVVLLVPLSVFLSYMLSFQYSSDLLSHVSGIL